MSSLSSDPVSSAAVSSAEDGISQAQDAIANIATSIFSGQSVNPADRDAVGSGLKEIEFGLGNITSYVLISFISSKLLIQDTSSPVRILQ